MMDGDTIFALATGKKGADVNLIGACAAEAFSRAILNAVYAAKPLANLPSANDLHFGEVS
jgi:L-aminopeptidase/D-esterase-like protein